MADSQRIEDLRRRVQRDPASIAFAQLAEELRRAGQFQESVDTCRAGLAIHPGYLSARVTLGRALIELEQLDPAQAELELVLKSAPENLAAIRGLADIFHRRGDMAAALAQYRAALALARNDPELQETVARLAREVEPQRPPAATEGLSFDQMHRELLERAASAAQPAAKAPPETKPEPTAQLQSKVESEPKPQPEAPRQEPSPPPESTLQPQPPAKAVAPQVDSVQDGGMRAADREHAERTVAALEQWLDAIHGSRPNRGA
jgi:tetratricopeptide (TPR) repeat protein